MLNVSLGDEPLVEQFLNKHGLNINMTRNRGNTPFHYVASFGRRK